MAVTTYEDRSLTVRPDQTVRTAWVDIDLCVLGSRVPLAIGDVEVKHRRLLQQGDCACFPPPIGHWRDDGRFSVDDGRHEYVAALCLGRRHLFVAWLTEGSSTAPEPSATVRSP